MSNEVDKKEYIKRTFGEWEWHDVDVRVGVCASVSVGWERGSTVLCCSAVQCSVFGF